MAKCKEGYELDGWNKCVPAAQAKKSREKIRKNVAGGAEAIARTIAGIVTLGGSEYLIRKDKKKKKSKKTQQEIRASKPKKLKIRRVK